MELSAIALAGRYQKCNFAQSAALRFYPLRRQKRSSSVARNVATKRSVQTARCRNWSNKKRTSSLSEGKNRRFGPCRRRKLTVPNVGTRKRSIGWCKRVGQTSRQRSSSGVRVVGQLGVRIHRSHCLYLHRSIKMRKDASKAPSNIWW